MDSTPTFSPPVFPWRGLRSVDSYGAGGFGSPRDGGTRTHDGVDFISVPGDEVRSPIVGEVTYCALAYPHVDGLPDLHSIHIDGDGPHDGWRVMLLYAKACVSPGTSVTQETQVGVAEDITAYYRAKHPDHPGEITNHVHAKLTITGPRVVNSALLLPRDLA